jgi:hypothetical protein
MNVEKKSGNGLYPDVVLDGSVLTISDQIVDLDQVRKDSENIVDLFNGPAYLANIIIPPNNYEMVDTGQTDEQGNAIYDKQLQPLNTDKLKLVIWPQPVQPETHEEI